MKRISIILFLIGFASNATADFMDNFLEHRWSDWKISKTISAYGSRWDIHERVQGSAYPFWHMSNWIPSHGGWGYSGEEVRLVNKSLGFNENILELILFPQRDGSLKPLLDKPFINKYGGVDYHGAYGVYEENEKLKVWLKPSSETGTHRPLAPYTNCGFLTAQEKIAYAGDRRHEPEVYYGEFDLQAKKFIIHYTSAPIQYVYWSEWGAMTSPFLEDRQQYRKPFVWDETSEQYVPGALEVRPEYVYLAKVEAKARLPLICSEDDCKEAKVRFNLYLQSAWQPAIEKELGRMSPHEKSTLRREECDGIGLNYEFGCRQIDDYGRNDGSKNVFPKDVKPPRVEDNAEEALKAPPA